MTPDEHAPADWISVTPVTHPATTPPPDCVWRACSALATHVLTVGHTPREMCTEHLRGSLGYVRDDAEYELARHQRQVIEHQATLDKIDSYLAALP